MLVNEVRIHRPCTVIHRLCDILTMLLIRFDAELNAAHDETSQERIAKEQLAREKATMKSDMDMLQQEMNVSYALSEQRIMCTHTHTHTHTQSI